MDVTYFVALSFVPSDDGIAPGEAVECLSANAAVTRAEALSRKPGCAGAIAFSRTGDPATGDLGDAKVIRRFGDVPEDLSALCEDRPRDVRDGRRSMGDGRGPRRLGRKLCPHAITAPHRRQLIPMRLAAHAVTLSLPLEVRLTDRYDGLRNFKSGAMAWSSTCTLPTLVTVIHLDC
jgi:hypothetical protein